MTGQLSVLRALKLKRKAYCNIHDIVHKSGILPVICHNQLDLLLEVAAFQGIQSFAADAFELLVRNSRACRQVRCHRHGMQRVAGKQLAANSPPAAPLGSGPCAAPFVAEFIVWRVCAANCGTASGWTKTPDRVSEELLPARPRLQLECKSNNCKHPPERKEEKRDSIAQTAKQRSPSSQFYALRPNPAVQGIQVQMHAGCMWCHVAAEAD